MASRRRSFLFLPLTILTCSVLGGFLGTSLRGAATGSSEDELKASLHTFTKVLDVVQANAADAVNPDKAIYNGAIPGMLHTLDPHSNFFDPKAFALMRDDQRGHYYGIGMQIGMRNGKTLVMQPFGGSPAFKAGLRPGDVILEVSGKKTDTLSSTEIADLLKGPRGTQVTVVVGREGHDKPITFEITRDEISRKSVQDSFWLKPGIMYLKVDQFNENTSREMEDNFKRLGEQNVKGLVLDLRGNPGGLLNEGVAVASHFLQKGQVVVSHRGRISAERPFTAKNNASNRDYPVVVLVNKYSASAAEIVAGALQDHDRGWILGDTTFGKGLVQTVYPMSENTGLALTTMHYYTPSGRLIQRDYSNVSFYDYYSHRGGEQKNEKDVHMTDSGRTVYGGGGITPDEKFLVPKLNDFQVSVLRKDAFFSFVAHYFGSRDAKLPAGYEPDTEVMNDFHQFLLKQAVTFSEADFAQNQAWLKQQLKREMYQTAFSYEQSLQVAAESDPTVLKAIEEMPKARNLLDTAKKTIVQRMQR